MGWQKGKKRGSKATHAVDDDGVAPIGHNTPPPAIADLTEAEKRALYLNYLRQFQKADEAVEEAKAKRTAVGNKAKSHLGKTALADIKEMHAMTDKDKVIGRMNKIRQLAQWLGMPIGLQAELFPSTETNWQDEGYRAGIEGETCNPPNHLGMGDQQKWIGGWHEGQSTLARALGKVDPMPPAVDRPNVDVSEQPFN